MDKLTEHTNKQVFSKILIGGCEVGGGGLGGDCQES